MRWLPPIVVGASELRWPLADASSSALETVLLTASTERLAALLAVDPALSAWGMIHATIDSSPHLASVDDLAKWMAPRLPGYFFASLDDPAWDERPSEAARERHAQTAAISVVTAELASAYAAHDGALAGEAKLAALVGAAGHLVEVCSVHGAQPSGSPLEVIGSELNARLHATGVLSEWLCRARAAMTGADQELPPGWDRATIDQRAAAVRTAWQSDDPAAQERLPLLLARLRRLEELESQFHAVLEREKLESLRQLAYGAGHEINNPLANISARAQTLIKEERDPERRRRLAAINSQAYRAHEMIADLMLFSRPPQLRPERVNLAALVDRVIRELLPEAQQRGASIQRERDQREEHEPAVQAVADGVQLAVALRAMCVNSLEALGSGGNIVLTVRPHRESGTRQWIELVVADDGPGIKPEVRRHLFDPFYSGREAGRGLGFGLSKCWRIITDHGGEIDVDSPTGRGAVFTIRLPAA